MFRFIDNILGAIVVVLLLFAVIALICIYPVEVDGLPNTFQVFNSDGKLIYELSTDPSEVNSICVPITSSELPKNTYICIDSHSVPVVKK